MIPTGLQLRGSVTVAMVLCTVAMAVADVEKRTSGQQSGGKAASSQSGRSAYGIFDLWRMLREMARAEQSGKKTGNSSSQIDPQSLPRRWTRPDFESTSRTSTANPMRPTSVTADPFANIVRQEKPKGGKKNGGTASMQLAYGSVPQIRDDELSVEFIVAKLIALAQADALEKGLTPPTTAALEKSYRPYARQLVKTLSQLSPEQQNFIFYGDK